MTLDLLELIEALLQANQLLFKKIRETLPKQYQIENRLVLYRDCLCVPEDSILVTCLIRKAHDQVSSAYLSATKTYQLLASKYHQKGMEASYKQYVQNCVACQKAHLRQIRTPRLIHLLPIPEQLMQHLCIDFKDFPKDKAGYDQIMVIIDRLLKQAISIPCHKNINARGMANLFV